MMKRFFFLTILIFSFSLTCIGQNIINHDYFKIELFEKECNSDYIHTSYLSNTKYLVDLKTNFIEHKTKIDVYDLETMTLKRSFNTSDSTKYKINLFHFQTIKLNERIFYIFIEKISSLKKRVYAQEFLMLNGELSNTKIQLFEINESKDNKMGLYLYTYYMDIKKSLDGTKVCIRLMHSPKKAKNKKNINDHTYYIFDTNFKLLWLSKRAQIATESQVILNPFMVSNNGEVFEIFKLKNPNRNKKEDPFIYNLCHISKIDSSIFTIKNIPNNVEFVHINLTESNHNQFTFHGFLLKNKNKEYFTSKLSLNGQLNSMKTHSITATEGPTNILKSKPRWKSIEIYEEIVFSDGSYSIYCRNSYFDDSKDFLLLNIDDKGDVNWIKAFKKESDLLNPTKIAFHNGIFYIFLVDEFSEKIEFESSVFEDRRTGKLICHKIDNTTGVYEKIEIGKITDLFGSKKLKNRFENSHITNDKTLIFSSQVDNIDKTIKITIPN